MCLFAWRGPPSAGTAHSRRFSGLPTHLETHLETQLRTTTYTCTSGLRMQVKLIPQVREEITGTRGWGLGAEGWSHGLPTLRSVLFPPPPVGPASLCGRPAQCRHPEAPCQAHDFWKDQRHRPIRCSRQSITMQGRGLTHDSPSRLRHLGCVINPESQLPHLLRMVLKSSLQC